MTPETRDKIRSALTNRALWIAVLGIAAACGLTVSPELREALLTALILIGGML